MRQSIEHDMYTTRLLLNGSCVNLGSFEEVRNREISVSEPIFFEFSLKNANSENTITYRIERTEDAGGLQIQEIVTRPRIFSSSGSGPHRWRYHPDSLDEGLYRFQNIQQKTILVRLFKLNPQISGLLIKDEDLERIHFVSADRIGPREFYEKTMLPRFPHVGTRGEFTINLLDKMGQELVNDVLCLGEDSRTLMVQTEAWLGTILNPLKLEVRPLTKTTLELVIGGNKPANVGFGYSIILPIIVSGLIAKPEEKLIIENPEIHLHPKAQTALIQFLVAVAKTGVQVFVESHSDHVLNALRIAVFEKQLTPENLSILYFQSDITSILVDEKGKLRRKTAEGETARIPKGFFDEWTNSMAKLF
jgi:hypothetical protein